MIQKQLQLPCHEEHGEERRRGLIPGTVHGLQVVLRVVCLIFYCCVSALWFYEVTVVIRNADLGSRVIILKNSNSSAQQQ